MFKVNGFVDRGETSSSLNLIKGVGNMIPTSGVVTIQFDDDLNDLENGDVVTIVLRVEK